MIRLRQRSQFYSLGIAVQNQDVYTVLLMWQSKQWQLVDYWHWYNKPTAPNTKKTQPGAVISAVTWQDFLHFLYQQLTAVGQLPKLTITIGIPHQACAWLPLCQGNQVEWQRQAAAHWQMPASQVLVDVLPINTTFSIMACIPQKHVQALVEALSILTPLSPEAPQVAIDTDLTCFYKLWPIQKRDHIALLLPSSSPSASLSSEKQTWQWNYCQRDGIHTCTTQNLPKSITDLFITTDTKNTDPNSHSDYSHSSHQFSPNCSLRFANSAMLPPIKQWCWHQDNVPLLYCTAWHLAFQPTVSHFFYKASWQPQDSAFLPGWQLLPPSTQVIS